MQNVPSSRIADIFPLEQLPPELLKHVLSYAIPKGLSFRSLIYPHTVNHQAEWMVQRVDSDEAFRRVVRRVFAQSPNYEPEGLLLAHKLYRLDTLPEMPGSNLSSFVALCRVSKNIGNEARGLFYQALRACRTRSTWIPC